MKKALILAPNRWDGTLEVGIFKFAKFLKNLGFEIRSINLEGFRYLPSKTFGWIFPKNLGKQYKIFWNLTHYLNSFKVWENWDILMCDASHMLFFANRIKARTKIYRLNDYLEGFGLPSFFVDEEKRFIELSHAVISAHSTLSYKVPDKEKFFLLPNPIDLELFPLEGVEEPPDLKNIPKPRIIYVGAVYQWFDWEAVIYCAKELKNLSFVIIGPYTNIPKDIPKNVFILGKRPHTRIYEYLYHCDIGFIPFKLSPLITHMDYPNKVLEYFAMGLPVVSIHWESFSKNFPEVMFYKEYKEIPQLLKEALKRGKDYALREKVLEFSSDKIFSKFKEIILELTHGKITR
ncbi:MAG: glycosyltransferase [candidate division WOR-3 bacterium]